jgi:hypothetical protein
MCKEGTMTHSEPMTEIWGLLTEEQKKEVALMKMDNITRAYVARLGLTANTLEETVYIALYYDGENKPLMGGNNYTLTFIPPPFKEPGFWSITMYDYKNNYPVKNPVNRYSLGSETPLIKNTNLGTIDMISTLKEDP